MPTLKRVKSPVRIMFIFLLAMIVQSFSSAQELTLGEIDFPTSGTPEAQGEFIQGMLYMHSFEYDPAAVAFRNAQAIDPDFAMAFWGEAMANHHSLWTVQHQQAAQDVLNKLGKSSKERAAKAPTQREKDFIHAAEILFGMTDETQGLDKLERDVHYRNTMKRVHMNYPDDLEARALYGLSILGVASANRDYATYMQAAAIITPVWDANHSHPGAAHYLIHSYDDPVHAILGLPMARAYEKIAVDAAHAQHMTSHIYVALGLWDDMIGANVTALSVESAKTVGEGPRSREAWHHRYWLHYGRLQQGRLDEAREMLTMARERISDDPLPREPAYYGAMYARYLIDTESWQEAEIWLAPDSVHVPTPHYYFARAYSAAQLGHLDEARDLLPKIQLGGKGANPEIILSQKEVDILQLEVQSVIALREGEGEKAVTMARKAAEMQASMPFRYGPPRISKPTAELLGDILYELGSNAEAILAYQDQLSRSKQRANSLIGLARATAKMGDDSTSQEAYGALANIWHSADESVTGLAEVTRHTQKN
jgi:tetratricopeptide (TPR) repeat protein